MTIIEFGSAPLSVEKLFSVVFCDHKISFDSTVASMFARQNGEPVIHTCDPIDCSIPLPAPFCRAYATVMLSLLINNPGVCSLDLLDFLRTSVNGHKLPALSVISGCSASSSDVPHSALLRNQFAAFLTQATKVTRQELDIILLPQPVLSIVTASLISYTATLCTAIQELSFALSCEVLCAKAKDVLDSTSYTVKRRIPALKVSGDHVRAVILGSKKVSAKGVDLLVSVGIALCSELRGGAAALRVSARQDICSAAYDTAGPIPGYEPTLSNHSSHVLNTLKVVAEHSAARATLVSLVEPANGIWRAPSATLAASLPAAATSSQMEICPLTLMQALNTVLTTLYTEVSTCIAKLSLAQSQMKKGKPQVGQGTLEAMETLGPLLSPPVDDVKSVCERLVEVSSIAANNIFAAKSTRRIPQPPTGTRDLLPQQTAIREQAVAMISAIFRKHGAVSVETPVFENRDILMGKYGEDQKLIYNIEDFGEETLSLRYDLTVPFARFCATHRIKAIKRYAIGRVYRRDKPVAERGRFREFYQCDFDIAAEPASAAEMVPDAELLVVVNDILASLGLGHYEILVNHREVLNAIMRVAGVPADKFRAVCSCVDQLDKCSVEEVRGKIVAGKGVSLDAADSVLHMIRLVYAFGAFAEGAAPDAPGSIEALTAAIMKNIQETHGALFVEAQEALASLMKLFTYISVMAPETLPNIKLDLSLARGLDYYTGVVFEARMVDEAGNKTGSIAGGGRYDKLLGMFRAEGDQLPAVGGSIGIERIFALLEARAKAVPAAEGGKAGAEAEAPVEEGAAGCRGCSKQAVLNTTGKMCDVWVCAAPGGSLSMRLRVAGQLWRQSVNVGMSQKEGGSQKHLKKDLEDASETGALLAIIIGGDELLAGTAAVKDLHTSVQDTVPLQDLIPYCMHKLSTFKKEYALRACVDLLERAGAGNAGPGEELRAFAASVRRLLD